MQKKIIILFITLFIASSLLLFYQSGKQSNPNTGKAWWSLYFTNPKDNSLNFSIENHSNKNSFHWEILTDGNKFQEGNVNVPKGEAINSSFQDLNMQNLANKKISVKVSADEEVEEIYKNL